MNFPQSFFAATKTCNTYEKHVPAPYVRKTFSVPEVTRAEILVSGLGFYDLYLNGSRITKGLLAPYISNPDDIVYFDRYDVTALLRNGANAVGLILGNGMQNCPGGAVWDFETARFRGVPRFAFRLTAALKNGEVFTLDADESFRTAPSGILFDDLRSGVFYDARQAIDGWCLPDFDDSAWQNVYRAESPRGEFRVCEADPIVVTEERAPVSVRRAMLCEKYDPRGKMRLDTEYKFDLHSKPGMLYDFGVNTAGILRLRIRGEAGQRIIIQMCEFVNSKDEPSCQNINFYPPGYAQTDMYICRGEGEEVFEPAFTYHGFRYALVFGLKSQQAKPETLTMLVANSDLRARGGFECSDETMNRLGEMARRSDLANFYYFPTDCPHREKNGWTGDAATSAEHMLLTLTPEKSWREWLRNICRAQAPNGALPGIVPTGGWGFRWGNGPAWDNVLTELCWQMYRMRGDLEPAKECSESMLRYLSYISQARRPDGLVEIGLGDWLQPRRGAGDPVSPLYVTDSVIAMYIAEKTMRLMRALQLSAQADFAQSLYLSLRKAIRDNLIDFGTMTVRGNCQTSQAICLYYGVFEPGEKAEASRQLVRLVEEADGHLDCGMIGLRAVFHALSQCGRGDLAFRMITRRDYPSYGFFVEQGYTALPEEFTAPEKLDDPNSLNHHFFGDVTSWFIQRVVGICVNPRNIGADRIDVAPDFLRALSFAKGYYIAPAGRVRVSWRREGTQIRLNIECPDAVVGDVVLPAGYVFKEPQRPSGRVHNATTLPLRSGEYMIEEK
ncbi:MAG: family 78 glycoside hydrolase catalytic domain [Clostridia bacterium]|nr:family 78 glycoside hydrolase catalytic domain [Clostridia bacterium]